MRVDVRDLSIDNRYRQDVDAVIQATGQTRVRTTAPRIQVQARDVMTAKMLQKRLVPVRGSCRFVRHERIEASSICP